MATAKKATAKKATAKQATAKQGTAKQATAKKPSSAHLPAGWTKKELAAVTSDLEARNAELRVEIEALGLDIENLAADASTAGGDQADTGSAAYERDHDRQLLENAQASLEQNERALDRIAKGTYGLCESCGQPIQKERLQFQPGATLCVPCKSRQERR